MGGGFGTDESGQTSPWFWHPEPGPVVFEPFKATTDYFATDKSCMLNFRVRDLDSLLEQLNARGIEIITKDEWDTPETGRFARIHVRKAIRSGCQDRRRLDGIGRSLSQGDNRQASSA